jgi:membrane-bound ClpP family serine protease
MGGKIESKTDFDNEYIGRIGKVVREIDPPITGRVVIGDSEWTAESASFIASGENVKVISQNNLTMKVEVIK